MNLGLFRRCQHCRLIRMGNAIANVVANAGTKQKAFLRNVGDRAAQIVNPQFGDVIAIQK